MVQLQICTLGTTQTTLQTNYRVVLKKKLEMLIQNNVFTSNAHEIKLLLHIQ